MKQNKTERFEFLLTKQERSDLKSLAKRRGVSQGDLLRGFIRRSAQKMRRKSRAK